jgi:hypothetical protein
MSLNRKQRRQLNKTGTLDAATLERELRESFRVEMNRAINHSVHTSVSVAAYVLHDSFGWGHDRIDRFLKRIDDISDDVMSGTRELEDLKMTLLKETKIRIT